MKQLFMRFVFVRKNRNKQYNLVKLQHSDIDPEHPSYITTITSIDVYLCTCVRVCVCVRACFLMPTVQSSIAYPQPGNTMPVYVRNPPLIMIIFQLFIYIKTTDVLFEMVNSYNLTMNFSLMFNSAAGLKRCHYKTQILRIANIDMKPS